jgi:hypothetical protein
MNKSTMRKLFIVLGLVAGAFLMVMPAQAKVAIGTANGWEFSTDGFINVFGVMEDADDKADGGVAGMTHADLDFFQGQPDEVAANVVDKNNKSFRIRTGLLPGLLAFNIKAPTTNGIDLAARVGFYPEIQDPDQARLNSSQDLAFGASMDVREVFITADGSFGQILAGRALHLFEGKNILNDMTLFGVGVQGGSANTTTYGYIGFGYTYTNFGSQFRYTTPDMGGVKIAVGILDPATISGGNTYNIVDSPGYEAEISYAGELGGGVKLQAWVNGMTQDAERQVTGTTDTKSVTASGFAGGVGVDVAGFHILGSGAVGSGIGSAFMMAADAVDSNDDERDVTSLLGQITYTILGATKIGIQYGVVDIDETDADRTLRTDTTLATNTAQIDKRTAYTVGVYHNITPSWQVIGEYTQAKAEWFDGADRESSIYTIGTFFYW